MWYLFGLITLPVMLLKVTRNRFNAAWKGQRIFINGTRCIVNSKALAGVPNGLYQVGIEQCSDARFCLRRERYVERIYKWLGLAKEHQTGDSEFDRKIYIESDNAWLHEQLQAGSELFDSVRELFAWLEESGCSVNILCAHSGRLWIEFSPQKNSGFILNITESLQKVSASVSTIGDLLNAVTQEDGDTLKDRHAVRTGVLLSISTGLLTNAVVHFLVHVFVWQGPVLAKSSLWLLSFAVSTTFIAGLVIATFRLLGRCSRTYLVLIEILILGYYGAFHTAYQGFRDLNADFDFSTPTRFETTLLGTDSIRRHRSTIYYLIVEYEQNTSRQARIRVPRFLYLAANKGDAVVMMRKSGLLGFAWVPELTVLKDDGARFDFRY